MINNFVEIFDVNKIGFRVHWGDFVYIILPVSFFFMKYASRIFNKYDFKFNDKNEKSHFLSFLLFFATVFAGFSFFSRIDNYRSIFKEKCELVEGEVVGFNERNIKGGTEDSFYIKDTFFRFSDFDLPYGFNHQVKNGGPLQNGVLARLCFLPLDEMNLITKVYIRDYQGLKPDYQGLKPDYRSFLKKTSSLILAIFGDPYGELNKEQAVANWFFVMFLRFFGLWVIWIFLLKNLMRKFPEFFLKCSSKMKDKNLEGVSVYNNFSHDRFSNIETKEGRIIWRQFYLCGFVFSVSPGCQFGEKIILSRYLPYYGLINLAYVCTSAYYLSFHLFKDIFPGDKVMMIFPSLVVTIILFLAKTECERSEEELMAKSNNERDLRM